MSVSALTSAPKRAGHIFFLGIHDNAVLRQAGMETHPGDRQGGKSLSLLELRETDLDEPV